MADVPETHPTDEDWFDRPMRWGQLTLVANDPGRYDVEFWLDYFRRTHCDAVCLSAGGCVAYYPTDVPLHHRSEWLGDGDAFGELAAGCREMGLIVVARTDPHACHGDVRDAHPDWIAVDADGLPRRHWSHPDYWVTCTLGPYSFELMTEVTREIVSRYMVDGVFCNRWAGSGMCFCEHCRANFRDFSGMDLPQTLDPQDAARRQYILWRQERLLEQWRLWDSEIRKINPAARFLPNTGGGALSELDMAAIGELAPMLVADRQARRGLAAPWAAGKNGKEYRATLGSKPVTGLFSVGHEAPHRWKDSVQAAPEVRIWVADAIAQGMRPWFCKFSGTLHDRRWLATVEGLFRWHHRNEAYLRNEANLARVAMVYSQQTAHFYGGPAARTNVQDHELGFYHALVEARVPFEMVHDRTLDAAHVDRFKLLVLPNIAALSDRQCEQLRAYVERGGSIVATHETGLYDEWGRRREEFGLAELFGVSAAGEVQGPMKNAYLRLAGPHAVLAGLEDASRIIHGVHRLPVEARVEFPERPITLIPPYPDLPMEEVYPREEQTDTPELYLREFAGGGRVAYFNWDIDRTFWEVLAEDHGKVLAGTVRWAVNEPPPVTVEGTGVLDIAVWRQEHSMTVHVVNLTNPMMMKGPYRELIPSGEQVVRVHLPEGAEVGGVHLLVSGKEPAASEGEGWLEVAVSSVLDREVVAIEFGRDYSHVSSCRSSILDSSRSMPRPGAVGRERWPSAGSMGLARKCCWRARCLMRYSAIGQTLGGREAITCRAAWRLWACGITGTSYVAERSQIFTSSVMPPVQSGSAWR
jgi:hypothetical protein